MTQLHESKSLSQQHENKASLTIKMYMLRPIWYGEIKYQDTQISATESEYNAFSQGDLRPSTSPRMWKKSAERNFLCVVFVSIALKASLAYHYIHFKRTWR